MPIVRLELEVGYLEQFDCHGFEIGDDLNPWTLGAQGGRVATGAGVHAGNDRAEGWTKGISRSWMVDISAHNNLLSMGTTGSYRGSLRDERHVTGWKVDIRTTKFSINLEANVGAVLTFGVGNMFHLRVR